ncbi:hypothetical protein V8F20_003395 [Naviculisporaceae sp. PSN 640]
MNLGRQIYTRFVFASVGKDISVTGVLGAVPAPQLWYFVKVTYCTGGEVGGPGKAVRWPGYTRFRLILISTLRKYHGQASKHSVSRRHQRGGYRIRLSPPCSLTSCLGGGADRRNFVPIQITFSISARASSPWFEDIKTDAMVSMWKLGKFVRALQFHGSRFCGKLAVSLIGVDSGPDVGSRAGAQNTLEGHEEGASRIHLVDTAVSCFWPLSLARTDGYLDRSATAREVGEEVFVPASVKAQSPGARDPKTLDEKHVFH